MQRQRGELVPIGNAISGLDDAPRLAIREESPQARHHFTRAYSSEPTCWSQRSGPRSRHSWRMMALCSLPAPTPAIGFSTSAVNGPYTLYMTAGGAAVNSPSGIFPGSCWPGSRPKRYGPKPCVSFRGLALRLHAGARRLQQQRRTRRRSTRLRNQMRRLFNAHVQLVYKDEHGEASVSSSVADSTAFWWNPKRPHERMLWESKIELGEKFFNEIINHPVPIDMNTLAALKRCALGLDLLPVAHLPDVHAPHPAAAHLAAPVPSVRSAPPPRPTTIAPSKTSATKLCAS